MSIRSLIVGVIAFLIPSGLWANSANYKSGEVIVKLKSQQDTQGSYAFLGKAVSKNMQLKRSWGKLRLHHFQLKQGQSVESALAELRSDPEVEYAEPNFILQKNSLGQAENAMTALEVQQSVETLNVGGGDSGSSVTEQAWTTQSTNQTVVAVIDTGLDMTHPLFVNTNAIWVNPHETLNGVDDDGNGYVDDINGWNFVTNSGNMYDDDNHGTHVSGIILSAQMGSAISDPNTAPSAQIKIMPLKFLDGNGVGSTADAINAIYYAINNGAKVLNNSWGGPSYSLSLHEAVAYSYTQGVVFVAAAGNSGSNNDYQPMYPSSYDVPHIISVAAVTNGNYLASFSNYGYNTVNLGSNGVYIVSSINGGGYAQMSGTSMAAPYVSGVAALMLNEVPSMLGYQVKSVINGQSHFYNQLSGKLNTEGKVDKIDALNGALGVSIMSTQPSYSVQAGRSVASSASDMGGAGCGMVGTILGGKSLGGPGGGGPGNPPPWQVTLMLIVLSIPMAVYMTLRKKKVHNRRKHERFDIDTHVKMKIGDKELVGAMSSISLGGAQINTNALLENGGVICMSIESPDGSERVEIKGKVVWSESQKAYGVQFAEANSSILNQISNWTRVLKPAADT